MTEKQCVQCQEVKKLEEFPSDKRASGRIHYRNKCKKCRNAEKLELKKKNPEYAERQKEAHKKWLRSPEGKEWNRKRGEINRQKPIWKEYQRKGRENYRSKEENRRKEAEYRKKHRNTEEYRTKNRIRLVEYRQTERYKQWRDSERGREIRYKARLRRRTNTFDFYMSPAERKTILERDNYTCQLCGIIVHDRSTGEWNTPEKAHIDHIVAVFNGGSNEPENLWTLCRTCNLKKGAKKLEDVI